ncbi:MAG: hypothetical protein B7Y02_08900 [Rhodobacterales bacterium 17-64-5]|nr:MAG: hypothetical protein B7Y02_08900 [Rhodobacterales bacterium 17-64-5]
MVTRSSRAKSKQRVNKTPSAVAAPVAPAPVTAQEGAAPEGAVPGSPDNLVARIIIRTIWATNWNADHPDGTPAERFAVWSEVRESVMAAEMSKTRQLVAGLRNQGLIMTIVEPAEQTPVQTAEAPAT